MRARGARREERGNKQRIRRAMLAKVHIAKKELGLKEHEYEAILEWLKVTTAADLRFENLEKLIKFFKFLGWQSKPNAQIKALRQRVLDETTKIQNGENRLAGLVKKICEVERLDWCRSVVTLERLIAVIMKISEGEKNEAKRLIQQGM